MQGQRLPRGSSYVNPSADDHDPSSGLSLKTEKESLGDLADDGQSILGVSLGPEQAHLASPTATDEQKIAALQDDQTQYVKEAEVESDSEPVVEENEEQDKILKSSEPAVLPHTTTGVDALPSPWTAGPKLAWKSLDGASDTRNLRQGGSDSVDEELGWRKYIPTLPTLPSLPSLKSLPVVGKTRPFSPGRNPDGARSSGSHSIPRRNTLASSFRTSSSSPTSRGPLQDDGSSSSQIRYQSVVPERTATGQPVRPSPLRRSTSDGSLHLQRSLSRASSLGDDSRWMHVHEQVNSRAKAIRDTLADSNLRLPRFPDLPSLSINQTLSDIQATRKRSTSLLINKQKQQASPEKPQVRAKASYNDSPDQQPYSAEKELSPPPGMTKTNAEAHPQFTRALKTLKGDVVVLGGYRGSILRSAQPPHRQCWVPVKVGLGLRKVNLEVGLEPEDEEHMEENIIPSGMLKNIGPVDISRRLFKRLSSTRQAHDGSLRIWDFGYDWRLSPHLLSDRLVRFMETLECNAETTPQGERGATVIAHSLGGLLTRHAVNRRPELFRGVVYAGVPHTCVNILGPLRNGDEVLLSSKVLTAQVNFTIRTSFALLPLDGKCFFNRDTNEQFDVDFFDPRTWEELCLSPCVARPLPVPEKMPLTSIGGIVESVTSALPTFNISNRLRSDSKPTKRTRTNSAPVTSPHGPHAVSMQMDRRETPEELGEDPETATSTAVTISKPAAMAYLARTLAEVKRFKEELALDTDIDARGAYPPAAVIYGKSVPTVYGACVKDGEAIKRADAYDDLAFASGDGVVLARAAQLPEGYKASKGGVVSSDRGHISLLGDLEAVGRCLNALRGEQRRISERNAPVEQDDDQARKWTEE